MGKENKKTKKRARKISELAFFDAAPEKGAQAEVRKIKFYP